MLDWGWLYYCSTVLLRMTEDQFWTSTPRIICELMEIHNSINNMNHDNSQGEVKEGFIDDIEF